MKCMTKDDYIITKDGEIINKKKGNTLKPQLNNKGYLRVYIGKKLYFVHRLVAEQYVPNPENKPQVNHKDGNKLNNNYSNLEWVDNTENRKHAVENGLHLCGEQCPYSKLTEDDVAFIRRNETLSIGELSCMFNVARSTIVDILTFKTWKRLKRYAELSLNEVIELDDKKHLG